MREKSSAGGAECIFSPLATPRPIKMDAPGTRNLRKDYHTEKLVLSWHKTEEYKFNVEQRTMHQQETGGGKVLPCLPRNPISGPEAPGGGPL